jgi:hypothetical protein
VRNIKKIREEQSKQINFSPRISRHNSNENSKKFHIGTNYKLSIQEMSVPMRKKKKSMGKHLYRSVKCILSKRS